MSDIDTLRILVSWACNLKCTYCCNEQERFRKDIKPTTLDAIKWNDYKVFCVSGGEPLLNMAKVEAVVSRIPKGALIVLYTNGILLNALNATKLRDMGVKGINVGLHAPATFGNLIRRISQDTFGIGLHVRFHAQDIHKEWLEREFPFATFRFWKMDDCDRTNEERVVLEA